MRTRGYMTATTVLAASFATLVSGSALGEPAAAERPAPYGAGVGDKPLPELEGVELVEHLGADLPLDTTFIDDRGQTVQLRELLKPGTPLILTFNYSNCPLLCSVQLTGLTEGLAKLERNLGDAYSMVTVVLDPSEKPARAHETKRGYLSQLDNKRAELGLPARTEAALGWTFLTGDKSAIDAVAEAVGFGYRYHPERKEYLHPAVFMLVTPGGKVAQYVYGVGFKSAQLNAAITSAALGATSEATQRFILSCYHYEAPEGFDGFRVMQIVGSLFAVGIVLVVVGLHLKSRLARRPVGTA